MKRILYLVGIGAVVVFIGLVLVRQKQVKAPESVPTPNATTMSWQKQVDEQGEILVEVTPTVLGSNEPVWKFEVALTTHAGSVDANMVQSAILKADTGNSITPTAWEGPGPGGHHISGNLIFNALTPTPTEITLQLVNIGGITLREFKWKVK